MARAVLSEAELRKSLEDQGFRLVDTKDGVRVLAPNGVGSAGWHPSMIGNAASHTYENLLANLRRIGWEPPTEVTLREKRLRSLEKARAAGEAKRAPCNWPDCPRASRPMPPQGRSAHYRSKHAGRDPDGSQVYEMPTGDRPTPARRTGRSGPVRTRTEEPATLSGRVRREQKRILDALLEIERASAKIGEARLALQELLNPLVGENERLRAQVEKFEEFLGRGIDELFPHGR